MSAGDHVGLRRAKRWAVEQALPLWSTAGYDSASGLFRERLDFDGRPAAVPQRRLMVQARQIATYARTSLAGWHNADEAVIGCLGEVERLYHHADGVPGWIFAIHPDGSPANTVRDLYGHAFILYALAWAYRRTGEPHWQALADVTLSEMDQIFAAPHGGFLDASPIADGIRRQNPHMHLLEALLALYEATGHERYLSRARALSDHARRSFMTADGALCEEFDIEWRLLAPPGENRVEPGHLFEWAWLFHEFARLTGEVVEEEAAGLIRFAIRHGFDRERNLFVDAVTETGLPLAGNFRAWPHAEAVKAFAAAGERGTKDGAEMADYWVGRMVDVFAPAALQGGWIDRIDIAGQPLVDHMPASTLYHLVGAILEAERASGSVAELGREDAPDPIG